MKYPWYKEYKVLGIKHSLEPYPDKPVYEILTYAAREFPKRGFIEDGKRITYPEIKTKVNKLAAALNALSFKKGEPIATILPISTDFVIADYAISRAALMHVPVSELDPIDSIDEKFSKCLPVGVICSPSMVDIVLSLHKKYNFKAIIYTGISSNSDIEGLYSTEDIYKNYSEIKDELTIDAENDVETLLFTGGTTGLLKGCMLTHKNIYSNSIQIQWMYGKAPLYLMRGAIAVLIGIPFFHSYGHIIMHSMTLSGFDMILIRDPRDIDYMIDMIKKYRPVLQFGVPTQYLKLSNRGVSTAGIIGISGSAALPVKIQESFDAKGAGIMEGYGLSEMSPVTHFNISFLYRILGGRSIVYIINMTTKIPLLYYMLNKVIRLFGSRNFGYLFTFIIGSIIKLTKKIRKISKKEIRKTIGIPVPDVEVKFLDMENGKKISINEMLSGKKAEMCLKGPQRMLGYYPEVGSGVDEEGYIRTGDVVKIDSQGFFYVVDRTKDMINISGYKVYSQEVDKILYTIEGVDIAATVGVPDIEREGSERVVVFIQLKENAKNLLNEEFVIDYLKQKLPKYAIPKRVIFLDEMPLTAIQKVDKKKLRKLAAEIYYND
jgi:acyl-CoA synthetase (AMP-forming)/AMP-acid ligase II